MPLPLQNFDMMYNIIKRLANTGYYGNGFPDVVVGNDVFNAFQKFYRSIKYQLKEQDDFYNEGNEDGRSSLVVSYRECPFYKHFVERPSPQMKKIFVELVKAMTRGHNDAKPATM